MRYGTWAECAEVCGYVRGPGVPVTRWRVFGGVGAVSCVVSVGLLCVCVVCGVCGVLVDSVIQLSWHFCLHHSVSSFGSPLPEENPLFLLSRVEIGKLFIKRTS